ncbi:MULTISPECIES: Ger(x)C family spore germination protein [Bacillus]|uniref:Ger(x)C family spore germination protein n=1 Tax=Bacillus TaxID=1386 RepID=UPI0002EF1F6F|nr:MULTISPECIES: Ger(x)C family spore germination protein [Bacillus]
MKHKISRILVTITCLILLSGCWDEKLIKETRFILSAAYDKNDNDKIIGTYSTPNDAVYPQSSIITTVKGDTVREITLRINDKVAETLDTSKLKVVFFGEKLAKEDGLYPYLDIFIREPNNPINPYLVIVKGDAKSYFSNPIPNESEPSEYFRELLLAHVDKGVLPNVNLLKGSRIFENRGFDILVPYITTSPDKTPKIDGLAIMDEDKFTGETLSMQESILFNSLKRSIVKYQPNLVIKLRDNEQPKIEGYITINLLESKRKTKVNIKNGKATADIKLNIKVEVIESPKMNVKKNREFITNKMEKQLTKEVNTIIKKLQKANCDGLAIGQQLHSFHNEEYEKLNWKDEAYKNADIKAKVKIEIVKHGLVD